MAERAFRPTIGLEIHAELKTQSKMFCSCANSTHQIEPNKNICPVCTGQPGVLPVPNEEAIKEVIKTGIALNCSIAKNSKFDRKNYFYPDLPKGYQISQFDLPICENGFLVIGEKKIRIKRIHLEEDAAKNFHQNGQTLVDYNRAGVPLLELVTEPDITSGEEAKKFGQELQLLLRYLNVCDGDMEKGQLRLEVNISVSESEIFGTKVEVKNINSFANAERAINYEIDRQVKAIMANEKIVQETRGFDAVRGITVAQRSKEGSSDYRYFPEPDIPVLDFSKWDIDSLKHEIPELPWDKRARFAREFELDLKSVEVLVNNRELADYYEKICTELGEAAKAEKTKGDFKKLVKLASNYLINDYLALMWATQKDDNKWPIAPENFAEFIAKVNAGEVNSASAKVVLAKMFATGADPGHLIQDLGLTQIDDAQAIAQVAQKVIQENPKSVADYKKGKENAIMFLVGGVMKEMKGRAKPDVARDVLKKILDAQ